MYKVFSSAFSFKILYAVMSYSIAVLIVRYFGKEEYAQYGIALAVTGFLVYPLSFGLDQFIVKNSLVFKKVVDFEKSRNNLISNVFTIYFLINLLGLFILLPLMYYFVDSIYSQAVLVSVIAIPFLVLRRLITSIQRASGNINLSIFPETTIQPVFFLFIFLFIFLFDFYSLDSIYIYFISVVISTICALILLCKTGCIKGFIYSIGNRSEYVKVVNVTFFICVVASLEGVVMYADRFIVAFFLEPNLVADYLIATRNASLVLMVESTVLLILMPEIAKIFLSGKNIKFVLRKQGLTIFIMNFFALIFLYLFGEYILSFFGDDMGQAFKIMMIIVLSYFLSSIFGPGIHILMMIGGEKDSAKIMIISSILYVLLNIVLVWYFGVLGAAYATFINEIVKKSVSFWILKSKYKCNSSIFS